VILVRGEGDGQGESRVRTELSALSKGEQGNLHVLETCPLRDVKRLDQSQTAISRD
jgi:hypothetical protein